jgi:hypothetical protein
MLYLIAATAVSVLATSPDQVKTFEQWWAESINGAESKVMLAGFGAEFTFAFTYPMPPEGLDALRESIKNKPDHPGWYEIRRLEKQQREGPEVTNVTVWRDREGTMGRANTKSGSSDWTDFATRPDGEWMLTPKQLNLKPVASGSGQSSMRRVIEGYGNHLRALLSNGFAVLARTGIKPGDAPRLLDDGRWAGTWMTESSGVVTQVSAEGNFDRSTGVGRMLRLVYMSTPKGERPAQETTQFEDFRLTLIGELPHRALYAGRPNQPSIETRLLSISPVSADQLRDLTADPAPERPDPVRGALTFKSIANERPGSGAPSADGPEVAGVPGAASTPTGGSRSTGLVVAGWSLAVAILGFLVWSYVRRR